MALEGSLESFGIGEIFQLIATQNKTGVLEIETTGKPARIRFVKGQMLDAFPGAHDPGRVIGNMLVSSALVTQRQLDYALGVQKRSLRRIGDILIRMGAVRTNEFQELLARQRREMAYSLLRLTRGKYIFYTEEVEFEDGVDTLMNVDALLMEGSRQIDEWPSILKRIPSDGRIYKRTQATIVSELTEEETIVLDLVDGVRTVKEILDRSRLGEFHAWSAMSNIYDDGLIAMGEKKPKKKLSKKAVIKKTKTSPVFLDSLVAVAVFVGALVLLFMPHLVSVGEKVEFKQTIEQYSLDVDRINDRAEMWRNHQADL